ncbi:uncharacterized protein LOC18430975 isoform X2 [Amborella trichopoda]|uniref:uncharacterized protein LOC18430975 isoform X2 n=1 Tax=Amborella trichopoda TaxID=13333 RepID=UPI0009BFC534|nr:uncharacterized protein LOC18430975 isoform X2 [Amborella trichopoda]|eukprot:XP_020520912.1 uncharacterized protein LOC18430975 isoform X2 [Amborella trichopoda]
MLMEMGRSWTMTVFTQCALFILLWVALYMGKSEKPRRASPLDLYFISVGGGERPPSDRTLLLRQMEKTARFYKVKFIVSIAELGEEDPLVKNATLEFPSLKVPWYTSGSGRGYFWKQVSIPYDRFLDIFSVDTRSLQTRPATVDERDQLEWLVEKLKATNGIWHIVIGFHPLINCQGHKNIMKTKLFQPLHHIFQKYEVVSPNHIMHAHTHNVYLSRQEGAGHYIKEGTTAYIGNPIPAVVCNGITCNNACCIEGMHNGFLLHRVSPLEMESYYINSTGKIVFRSTLYQGRKEVM